TTDRNTEQDWLKTNLARFTNLVQGQRDLVTVGRMLLSELTPLVEAHQGVMYQLQPEDPPRLRLIATYADDRVAGHSEFLSIGEGLIGQCAVEKRRFLIAEPGSDSVAIRSGLLRAMPRNIVVLPVLFEGEVKAVIELASLGTFTKHQIAFLEQLTANIGIVL